MNRLHKTSLKRKFKDLSMISCTLSRTFSYRGSTRQALKFHKNDAVRRKELITQASRKATKIFETYINLMLMGGCSRNS